jgi:lipoprotein signal peptidase
MRGFFSLLGMVITTAPVFAWLFIWSPTEWQWICVATLLIGGIFNLIGQLQAGFGVPTLPTGDIKFNQRFASIPTLIIIWHGFNIAGWFLFFRAALNSADSAILWWYCFQIPKFAVAYLAGSNNAERVKQGQSPIGNYLNNQDL